MKAVRCGTWSRRLKSNQRPAVYELRRNPCPYTYSRSSIYVCRLRQDTAGNTRPLQLSATRTIYRPLHTGRPPACSSTCPNRSEPLRLAKHLRRCIVDGGGFRFEAFSLERIIGTWRAPAISELTHRRSFRWIIGRATPRMPSRTKTPTRNTYHAP